MSFDADFDQLAATIRRMTSNAPVWYLPNPGNWGDAMIRYGTVKFLADYGIDSHEMPTPPRRSSWLWAYLRGGTVIYGGSGGWNTLYGNQLEGWVDRLRKRFHVIVLPSTYAQGYSIPNTSFFSRDKFESLSHVPVASFCHDMAFYLNGKLSSHAPMAEIGYFFRTDSESSRQFEVSRSNRDLSAEGDQYSPLESFCDGIGEFSVIHTDRLHIGIVGAILGREVHLYPNSYFKNRAVYQSSIAPNFSNVTFHED